MSVNRSRSTLVLLVASVAMLAVFASSALAASPEAPTLRAGEVSSGAVTLFGMLNPGATEPREGGTYQFVYRATSGGGCKGAGEAVAPETPGLSFGFEREELSPERVYGLMPGTEYAVCLVATEPGKTEPAVSAPVRFKTRASLEQPETMAPPKVASESATFEGIVNPHAAGEEGEFYSFVYQAESSECTGEHEIHVLEPPLAASAAKAQHVSAEVKELLPRTTYTYCLLVTTEFGESAQGEPVTFTTPPGAATVSAPTVADVQSTEATVSATVNPGGAATTIEVSGSGIATTSKSLPASKLPVLVQQRLSGLTAGTTYAIHFRGVNTTGEGEVGLTFTTLGAPSPEEVGSHCANKGYAGFSLSLPDCRVAELVSPANEVAEVYGPGGEAGGEDNITTGRPFRASVNGEKVTYVGDPGLTGGDGSTAKGHGNEYMATRTGAGWSAVNITPPVGEGENPSQQREYKYFSPDLSSGILLAEAENPLSAADPDPRAPENCAALYGVNPTVEPAAYSALFTETLSPGFCGNTVKAEGQGTDSELLFAGETPDHSIKLFDSSAALVEPAKQAVGRGGNVYVSTDNGEAPKVVNVLPDGAVEPNAVAGGPSELNANGPDLSNVLAPAGNRVIWSAVTTGESDGGSAAAFPTSLYARNEPLSPGAQTVELDEAEAGAHGTSGDGRYWTTADNGNDVFFTDCHRLVEEATAHEEEGCQHLSPSPRENLVATGSDLYEYDFSRPQGERLVDLTIDHDGSDPLGANVQGVIGTSEDGDIVYFVAGGTLGAGPNPQGEVPHAGKCEIPSSDVEKEEIEGHVPAGYGCNLFELHFDGTSWEAPKFIATLSVKDNVVTTALNDPEHNFREISGDWNPRLGSRTAEVTPDGEALIFSSTQELTGYDVASAGAAGPNEQGANEIYLFRASADALTCVSCDPQNRPPNVGDMRNGSETYVPVSSSDTFMHRWVNAAGTEVFFDSSQPLVEKDVNGTQDVYEWAAEGTPSCPSATSVYGGCVFLLTGGESEAFSFLADIDESGSNVFVVHRGPLYGAGPVGTKSELYDLRASGGQPPVVAEGCTTACAVGQAPLVAALPLSTATVTAGGNPPPSVTKRAVVPEKCKKGFAKKRGKCVKTKAKKKVKQKKANRERRGK